MLTMTPVPSCAYCRDNGLAIAASFQVREDRSPQSGVGDDWAANVDACLGCARAKRAAGATVTVHPAAVKFRSMADLEA